MIKKILASQLRPGMYVSDFNAGWLSHPFAFNSMKVENEEQIQRVLTAGIRELFIDTERGLDIGDHVPTAKEAEQATQQQMLKLAESQRPRPAERRASMSEEIGRAQATYGEATRIIRGIMEDIRLGHQVDVATARPTVEKITTSVMRNSNAMMMMRRLRNVDDDYTFLHSVNVCAMMTCFGKVLEMDLNTIHDMALGALLHDVGKMRVVLAILNKPARLSDDEYKHMKSHVILGSDVLRNLPGIPALALEPVEQHHERFDGSGYPKGLKGEEISKVGRMAAIVDVYDAITSNRIYRQAMSPAAGVQKMFEWSKYHFDPELMKAFLKSVGIYPVGSLVKLESGRLGVVIEQCEDHLLTPIVKVVFDYKRQHYIQPELVDLSKPLGHGGGDRIIGYEVPDKVGVDVSRFLP